MAGCVSEPDGCGLIETPGLSNVHGAPGVNADGSKPPPAALKNPRRDSRMLLAAVKPRFAIDAASRPLSAARPAWNGWSWCQSSHGDPQTATLQC